MSNNQEDLFLLNNDPDELFKRLQGMISIIVQINLIDRGVFPYHEKEELEQMVNVKLSEKIDIIRIKYDGRAALRTFISVIVLNICRAIARKRKTEIRYDSLPDTIQEVPAYNITAEMEMALIDEYKRFEKILLMFHRKKAKIELCLKLIYRIVVFLSDFANYCYKLAQAFYDTVEEKLPHGKSFTEKEIYKIITPYINKCDKKNNTNDAVRRWLKDQIVEMIKLLNTNRIKDSYDKEVFQILVEKYYDYKKVEKKFPFSPSN